MLFVMVTVWNAVCDCTMQHITSMHWNAAWDDQVTLRLHNSGDTGARVPHGTRIRTLFCGARVPPGNNRHFWKCQWPAGLRYPLANNRHFYKSGVTLGLGYTLATTGTLWKGALTLGLGYPLACAYRHSLVSNG